MGKISNKRIYETVTPTGSDYLIGTDAEDRNKTKNFKIQAIADFVGQNVTIGVGSLNTLTGALTLVGGDGLTITDNGSDTITISMDRPDYVESINSLIGAVDIVGSTNIVVTDNGNDTITVDTQNLAKTNEANTFVNDQTMTKNLSVGTTVFNVDSIAERVGVNTATPSKSFDVVGDTIIQGLTGDVLTLKSPSENGDNYILFTNSLDSDKGWVGYRGTSNILQIDNLIDDIDISSLTGSVKLSLGGSVKLETTATGVDVNGGVTATGAVTGSNLSGTNTGDQTSIVGITGTTAEFNTALSDGTFATSSDLLGYVTLSTTQTITGQKTFSQDLIANGITVGSGNIQKNLGILTLGSEEISLQSLTGVKWLKTAIGGSLILYHNGNSKLTTTSTGVAVTGDVVADSHVTNGGTSSDFVKGDGSLDSTDYQGQIDAEEAARIAADSTLQGNIDNEESARIAADSGLQSQITTNDGNISTNTSNISTNTSNIATNASSISANTSDIADNTSDITDLQNDKQDISEKNQANGYAPLDSGAKIPLANLPDSILGQVSYQGTWAASTNTPTLANPPSSTTKGEYYVASDDGTQFGIDFRTGEWIISNGTAWEKVNNTDAVTTVFNRIGNVVANESDYLAYYPLLGTTISAGSGLIGGGDLSANRTISHDDTSSQGSVNNSGGIVIQDVTLDPFGHVTGLGSIDLDGRYVQTLTGTTQTLAKFTASGNTVEDSNIVLASGANFVDTTIGSTSGAVNQSNNLYLLATTRPQIYLTASSYTANLFNENGDIELQAQFTSPSLFYNSIFRYNGSSATNRSLVFQTEGLDRLTINQSGSAEFSSNLTATTGEFISGGQDGSLGSVVRIGTTNTNAASRNWAIVSTWDNFGDLAFRVSNALGGNALLAGSNVLELTSSGIAVTGDLTTSGIIDITSANGFALGGITNRRRIQAYSASEFGFLGDANGYAQVGGAEGTQNYHFVTKSQLDSAQSSNTLQAVTDRGATTTNVITVGNIVLTNIAPPEGDFMVTIDQTGVLSYQIIPSNSANTLDSVTDNGSSTANSITVGGATINGGLTVQDPSIFSREISFERYAIMKDGSGNTTGVFADSTYWTGSGHNLAIAAETGKEIEFYTNGSPTVKMRIDTAGNLTATGTGSFAGDVFLTSSSARLKLGADGGYGLIQRGQATSGTSTVLYFGETLDTGATIFRGSGNTSFESNVGIGVSTSLQGELNVGGNAGGDPSMYLFGSRGSADNLAAGHLTFRNVANGVGDVNLSRIQSLTGTGSNQTQKGQLAFSTNDGSNLTERMRIDSSGNVGIGTDNPGDFSGVNWYDSILDVKGVIQVRGDVSNGVAILQFGGDTYRKGTIATSIGTDDPYLAFGVSTSGASSFGIEAMRIDSSGNVNIVGGGDIIIGIASGTGNKSGYIFSDHWNSSEENMTGIGFSSTSTLNQVLYGGGTSQGNTATTHRFYVASNNVTLGGGVEKVTIDNTGLAVTGNLTATGSGTFGSGLTVNGAQGLTVSGGGDFNADVDILGDLQVSENLNVDGSVSKGSGSFKIDHPLPEKKDTHHLVHSFVEAPRANNIYDGTAILVDGKAVINLDEEANMTEGTFVLLNRGIKAFTSNESDWDAVRGNVEGNILTVECQNPKSTATVNWLVIGERQDKHMYDTQWTDENGRVITEPLKKVEPTPEEEEEEITIIENN